MSDLRTNLPRIGPCSAMSAALTAASRMADARRTLTPASGRGTTGIGAEIVLTIEEGILDAWAPRASQAAIIDLLCGELAWLEGHAYMLADQRKVPPEDAIASMECLLRSTVAEPLRGQVVRVVWMLAQRYSEGEE